MDRTEDFVLLERVEKTVVKTPGPATTVVVGQPESRVITTEKAGAVSIETPAITVVAVGQIGPRGADGVQGEPGSGTAQVISALNSTGVAINRGTPVSLEPDGTIVKAQAGTNSRVAGLVADAVISNNTYGVVQIAGSLLANQAEWEDATVLSGPLLVGKTYFLSTIAGRMTTTPDTSSVVAVVGKAITDTSFMIDVEPPIF